MEICYHNYLINPSKRFALKLIQKSINAFAFIPFLWISAILITGLSSIAFGAEIHLTPEEQAWLLKHPDIKLGAVPTYPPLVIKNVNGTYTGILVDLFELINQRLNTNIQLHIEDSWQSIQGKAKNRNIDGLASGGRSESREEYLNPTDTVFSSYYYIFARTNDQLHLKSVKDLKGMRIGYKRADKPVKSVLNKYVDVTQVPYDDNAAMTRGLMNKEVDVLIGWISYDFWRRDKLQGSVENILLAIDNPLDSYIHIRKDWSELIPILNKVLSSIRQNELPKIMDKWFIERPQSSAITKIHLTKKEQAWLEENQPIRVRVADFPPYIIPKKDGPPEGIVIDSLKLITERTGVKFNFAPSNKTFKEALDGIKNSQGPDVIAVIVRTPERQKSILFTSDFIRSPWVIFMRADTKRIFAGMGDLIGKKVAILRGGVLKEMIKKDYPEVKLILFNSHIEAIDAVANKEADAYIGNLTLASYHILKNGYYNLRLAAPSPFGDQVLSMGIRNDWPELASIIDKGLSTITPEEQAEIRNRYISLSYEQLNTAVIIKWSMVIAGIILGIMLLFFFWYRSLTKKIKERTFLLENSKKSLEIKIAERQQAENALRKSEEKHRTLFETMIQGVVYHSSDGQIISANPSAESILGLTLDQMQGRTPTDPRWKSIHEDGSDFPGETHPAMISLKTSQQVLNVVMGVFHPDKESYRWINVNSIPKFRSGEKKPYQVYATFTDITENKKLVTQLLQSHKMESIGTLAGGIAHDFNNIMAIIVGNTELALDDVPKWNSAHSSLEEIKTASLRAKNIVKQLLSFSRKADQKLQPIQIALVIKDSLKFLCSTIPTTINIHQDIQTTDEMILADPTQINQIIMNLCINASHTMEQTGGDLTITVEKVILDYQSLKDYPDLKSGDHVKIMVSDTGPGIDPEIIDQIFDPYFTTKEIGKGSGMGLAVVHGIVKNHNGVINVDSSHGKGTKFSILFPLTSEKPVVKTKTIQDIPRGNETILFVDDEISITHMVERMFERLGYKIETATTPQDALELFRTNPDHFDLVITDMTMPQMTGVKLSEKLMDIREDIPIIICTGHSALVDEERAKKLGLAAYVMKPIDMQEMAQTIRKVLDKT